MRVSFLVLLSLMMVIYSPAYSEETLAEPKFRKPPAFPEACFPEDDQTMDTQFVAVVYDVTKEGLPINVRVRESSNPCFESVSVAAVRNWKFEPRRVNGAAKLQTDLETVFKYRTEAPTTINTFDARPLKRVPPAYPDRCQGRASNRETVVVEFDVTEKGRTTNAKVIESTNSCLNKATLNAINKWRYSPKIDDGKPVMRRGVRTTFQFDLSNTGVPPEMELRGSIASKLNKARRLGAKDPVKALELLEQIEADHGDDFTAAESAAFHQVRGPIRIRLEDYEGALDDLRIARQRATSAETQEALDKTIIMLEAYLAQQASQNEANSTADDSSADQASP